MKKTPTTQSDVRLNGALIILVTTAILMAPSVLAEDSEQQMKREANFKAADADGDGALTSAEFQAFIDANAEDNLGRAALIKRFGAYDRAFNRLDTDNNGTVTWSDVMDALAKAN
jgi:Ca2+-binding EF-hand superfamily protein